MEDPRAEIEALVGSSALLDPLDAAARGRVLRWLADRYGVAWHGDVVPQDLQHSAESSAHPAGARISQPQDLPELFERASPRTQSEKALVVGYWFQQVQGDPDLDAARLNRELRHLGHPVANITAALTDLMQTHPKYVLQTRKSGATRQARKKYRLTAEGLKRVTAMMGSD